MDYHLPKQPLLNLVWIMPKNTHDQKFKTCMALPGHKKN